MRVKSNTLAYWEKHKCFECGRHSFSQRDLKLKAIGSGKSLMCEDCYKRVFGK